MGENIGRRGATFWFRRRVPKPLRSVIDRLEISVSLGTFDPAEAAARARQAWLRTEEAFRQLAYRPLSADQADLVVRRLLSEPLWTSATASELVDQVAGGEDGVADILFRHAHEILPSLSEEDAARLMGLLSRLADKAEVRTANGKSEAVDLQSRVAALKQVIAEIREARAQGAKQTAVHLSARAARTTAAAQLDLIVEKRVASRVAPLPPGAASMPAPSPVPAAPIQVYLLSEGVESFFKSKRYPAHTEHQSRAQSVSGSRSWETSRRSLTPGKTPKLIRRRFANCLAATAKEWQSMR